MAFEGTYLWSDEEDSMWPFYDGGGVETLPPEKGTEERHGVEREISSQDLLSSPPRMPFSNVGNSKKCPEEKARSRAPSPMEMVLSNSGPSHEFSLRSPDKMEEKSGQADNQTLDEAEEEEEEPDHVEEERVVPPVGGPELVKICLEYGLIDEARAAQYLQVPLQDKTKWSLIDLTLRGTAGLHQWSPSDLAKIGKLDGEFEAWLVERADGPNDTFILGLMDREDAGDETESNIRLLEEEMQERFPGLDDEYLTKPYVPPKKQKKRKRDEEEDDEEEEDGQPQEEKRASKVLLANPTMAPDTELRERVRYSAKGILLVMALQLPVHVAEYVDSGRGLDTVIEGSYSKGSTLQLQWAKVQGQRTKAKEKATRRDCMPVVVRAAMHGFAWESREQSGLRFERLGGVHLAKDHNRLAGKKSSDAARTAAGATPEELQKTRQGKSAGGAAAHGTESGKGIQNGSGDRAGETGDGRALRGDDNKVLKFRANISVPWLGGAAFSFLTPIRFQPSSMRVSIGKPEFERATGQKLENMKQCTVTVGEVAILVGGQVVTKTEQELRDEVEWGPEGPVLKGASSMG